jgi:hypothetical protein
MPPTTHALILGCAFGLAAGVGAAMAASGYCAMAAVADAYTHGDLARARAWAVATAVAVAAAAGLEWAGVLVPAAARVPYTAAALPWLRIALGGMLFGVGMVLAGGCVSRCLVRAGGGNGKSWLVLLVAGGVAWLLTRTSAYALAFAPWLDPQVVDLTRWGLPDQRLGSLLARGLRIPPGPPAHAAAAVVVALALATFALSPVARGTANPGRLPGLLACGAVLGGAVGAGWWLTAGPWGQRWREEALFEWAVAPAVGVQSFTFVAPLADLLRYLAQPLIQPTSPHPLTFGAAAALGLIAGSLVYHLARRRWRWEGFAERADLLRHLVGGALLGGGGVLALGCTVGQGVTGISTLALGSFLAVAAMVVGALLALWGLMRWG